MSTLQLADRHLSLGARFTEVNGMQVADHYGDPTAEHNALCLTVGAIDLSGRGRICLVGADRERFLNGQVTNDLKHLSLGAGCYAALVNAKGKMLSDMNIYRLENELLLDFEPGLTTSITRRLEQYAIADDVQVVDAAPFYGLITVQGPRTEDTITALDLGVSIPAMPGSIAITQHSTLGEIYLANQPRLGTRGCDWFVPIKAMEEAAAKLSLAVTAQQGRWCGWQSLELARIESGIPRYGQDIDETNLPPEAGLDDGAISYTKGCYIGQEVIARIRTYGQVAKALRGLRLIDELPVLPSRGDKLSKDGREIGYVTSVAKSRIVGGNIALAYVRREANQIGTHLRLHQAGRESEAVIVSLPFVPFQGGRDQRV